MYHPNNGPKSYNPQTKHAERMILPSSSQLYSQTYLWVLGSWETDRRKSRISSSSFFFLLSSSSSSSSGNRTPGGRFYSAILGRLRLHPPAHTQLSFKALGCSYNCMRLTCGSFELTHMSLDDHAAKMHEGKTLLQRSQPCHNGEFRHVRISARQRSLSWTESSWAFPENDTTRSYARAMADNGETKGLITPPPRWVST